MGCIIQKRRGDRKRGGEVAGQSKGHKNLLSTKKKKKRRRRKLTEEKKSPDNSGGGESSSRKKRGKGTKGHLLPEGGVRKGNGGT